MKTGEELAEQVKEAEKKRPNPQHCTECGAVPAYVPRVNVLRPEAGDYDTYHLQLPPLCDSCVFKKGLTRHGIYVRKPEMAKITECLQTAAEETAVWAKRSLERGVQELVSQGMSEEDAKGMLGVQ